MRYYEVLVGAPSYHGQEALTYSSEQPLPPGQVVAVPLRQGHVLGIIVLAVDKPAFSVKKITSIFPVPPLPMASLQILQWLHAYYPAPLGMVTQLFLPKTLSEKLIHSNPIIPEVRLTESSLPPLTVEQKHALNAIGNGRGVFLLHGETGSGKTRVYLELALAAIAAKRSALILTPEIALTSQLVSFFKEHSTAPVILLHSQLTESKRRTAWLQIAKATQPLIVIGPRSALFSPIHNLGVIVVDEMHEPGYKQEQAPHYQASRVAGQLAKVHDAKLVMGSATPTVEDYFIAETKRLPILRMRQLAMTAEETTKVSPLLVDLKDRSVFSRSPHISDPLIKALGSALERNEQSLLFLNRRGTARVIACQNCGWQALCPYCDLPLTYHGDSHTARCHVCNFQRPAPSSCSVCSSPDIVFKSIGTKAVADEVHHLFPGAIIKRFDTDNKKAETFIEHYSAVKAGKVDILVGTQALAKGLDLPRLSVVGVIQADTSLYLPDYTADERTYQLLYQVVGRIDRGHVAGQAIIQTYDPENTTIQAAITRDWERFYTSQLTERQTFLFPPFCFLLKLTCRRARSGSAESAAVKLAAELRKQPLDIQIVGPSPAFHEKLGNQYQWQLVVKAKRRSELLKVIKQLPANWSYDIDPADLL